MGIVGVVSVRRVSVGAVIVTTPELASKSWYLLCIFGAVGADRLGRTMRRVGALLSSIGFWTLGAGPLGQTPGAVRILREEGAQWVVRCSQVRVRSLTSVGPKPPINTAR